MHLALPVFRTARQKAQPRLDVAEYGAHCHMQTMTTRHETKSQSCLPPQQRYKNIENLPSLLRSDLVQVYGEVFKAFTNSLQVGILPLSIHIAVI